MSDTTPNINEQVRTIIQAAVVQSLSSSDEVLNNLVAAAINGMVDGRDGGKLEGYGSEKHGMTFLEWVAKNQIRIAVVEAIKQRVEALAPEIDQHIQQALEGGAFTEAFANALGATMKDEWRINIKFEADKKERETW